MKINATAMRTLAKFIVQETFADVDLAAPDGFYVFGDATQDPPQHKKFKLRDIFREFFV